MSPNTVFVFGCVWPICVWLRLACVWGCVLLLLLLLIEGWGRLMVDSVLVVYRCVLAVFWCVLLVYWGVLVVFGKDFPL